jgi:hypothetical protein
MLALLRFFLAVIALPFKSRRRLEAENAVLRHQLIVLRRRMPDRVVSTENLNPDVVVMKSAQDRV